MLGTLRTRYVFHGPFFPPRLLRQHRTALLWALILGLSEIQSGAICDVGEVFNGLGSPGKMWRYLMVLLSPNGFLNIK